MHFDNHSDKLMLKITSLDATLIESATIYEYAVKYPIKERHGIF